METPESRKNGKDLYLDRERSWVEFNARVLGEAERTENPLLERLRFLVIVSSNFDEFFMVRVAALKAYLRSGANDPTEPQAADIFDRLWRRIRELVNRQYSLLYGDLLPALREAGLTLVELGGHTPDQQLYLRGYFRTQILPVLTPVRIEVDAPFPFTGTLHHHILFQLSRTNGGEGRGVRYSSGADDGPHLYAFVQLPRNMKRLVGLPDAEGRTCFALLEHVIAMNADMLFPGHVIRGSLSFRVSRDANLGVDERRDEDFVEAMEQLLASRRHSRPVRLEVSHGGESLMRFLTGRLEVDDRDVYAVNGPIDLTAFSEMVALPGFDALRYPGRPPRRPVTLGESEDLWGILRTRDVLLHHPYESFEPVIRLLDDAASDPSVLAIKMTLYRTSGESPVIRALARAAENGKQVVALVELKARFDEERNIGWAEKLEQAGAIVIYGIADLKVHAKALLIVRREQEGIRRYVHLGTGNYNEQTVKLYTDFGVMTSDENMTFDTALFFNTVTGYSTVPNLKKLVMAPLGLKDRLVQLIDREAERSSTERPGHVMAKINSLTDTDVVDALYRASRAGVKIELNVRGPCRLIPGMKGISENISVLSIVGRFLEHARVVYFSNGGRREVYLSSADWMPRNLERRVELMFPVEQRDIKERLIESLRITFSDNVNAYELLKDGTYRRRRRKRREKERPSQRLFYDQAVARERRASDRAQKEFVVRRKPPPGGDPLT